MDINPVPFWENQGSEEDLTDQDPDLENIETEVPVPDRLLGKSYSRDLVSHLKLSQKIGLLLWMNRENLLSDGGKERLLYLQRKASEEAILAGLKFLSRLSLEVKLQSDFKPHMIELNRRPQSKRFRVSERRRIGVGYRDKGTLPDLDSRVRSQAQEASFIYLWDLPEGLQKFISALIPTSLEGDWVDLEEVGRIVSTISPTDQHQLLNQL